MPSADYARQICGAGSQLARMVEAYRQTDPFGEAVCDCRSGSHRRGGNGYAADGDRGGNRNRHGADVCNGTYLRVQASVTNGDNVATRLPAVSRCHQCRSGLPFTASSLGLAWSLTARHRALREMRVHHQAPHLLRLWWGEVLPAGVQIAVATGTAGTGAPVLTGAVAAMADEPFDYRLCRSTAQAPLTYAGDRDER